MDKIFYFFELYAPSVLRYGMAIVILWFSVQQFLHADIWTAYIPDSIVAMTHLNAVTLVYGNAVFELVFGVLLVFGWQVRIAALLLAVHLFDIMYVVGYGEIGVRDFGLAIATFVIFMNGSDPLCIQQKNKISYIPKAGEVKGGNREENTEDASQSNQTAFREIKKINTI